jgi:hypothetical protein
MVEKLKVFPIATQKDLRACSFGKLIRASDTNRTNDFGLIVDSRGADAISVLWLSAAGPNIEFFNSFSELTVIEFEGNIHWEIDQSSDAALDPNGTTRLAIGYLGYYDQKILLAARTGNPSNPFIMVNIELLKPASNPMREVPLQFAKWSIWLADQDNPQGACRIYSHDAQNPVAG